MNFDCRDGAIPTVTLVVGGNLLRGNWWRINFCTLVKLTFERAISNKWLLILELGFRSARFRNSEKYCFWHCSCPLCCSASGWHCHCERGSPVWFRVFRWSSVSIHSSASICNAACHEHRYKQATNFIKLNSEFGLVIKAFFQLMFKILIHEGEITYDLNLYAGTITQLFGAGESECSVIMLWTYALASVSITLWSTFFLWLVSWTAHYWEFLAIHLMEKFCPLN